MYISGAFENWNIRGEKKKSGEGCTHAWPSAFSPRKGEWEETFVSLKLFQSDKDRRNDSRADFWDLRRISIHYTEAAVPQLFLRLSNSRLHITMSSLFSSRQNWKIGFHPLLGFRAPFDKMKRGRLIASQPPPQVESDWALSQLCCYHLHCNWLKFGSSTESCSYQDQEGNKKATNSSTELVKNLLFR